MSKTPSIFEGTPFSQLVGRKIILIITILILFFLQSGCSSSKDKTGIEKPVAVEIKEIQTIDLPVDVETTGRLSPNREVMLMAEVSGAVKTYFADMGDSVEKNQALVKINPVDYQLALNEAKANLASAQAQLDLAKKSYERSKILLPRDVISKDTFEKSESQYKAALAGIDRVNAMVDIAQERLKKTVIRAPFPGLVAARMVEVGQTIGAGQPVMNIIDLDLMRIKISLSEKDYIRLDKNDPVSVSIDTFPQNSLNGHSLNSRIDLIGVKADPRTSTFDVEILVDNPELILKAGLTARVRITADIIPNAILIPQSTILYRENSQEVFIVGADNKAKRRIVQLGVTVGADVQVLSGLTSKDKLVITGGQYLEPGDTVMISSSEVANTQ
ncbi:MAG: efflux RND transporter periplasmic adaptor subunit [Deltaproteobacteria bacterium]|nr:efflux RND transporter periplasmic adaptor subunit [Deltaproteobacteria bacterium]